MKIINIIFSDDIFGGFETYVKIDENILSIQDIINYSVNNLKKVLEFNTFNEAINILTNKYFHIHDRTYDDIVYGNNNVVYICAHC